MEIRATLGPAGAMTINPTREDEETDDIEKQIVFENVKTFDDAFVIHDSEEHDLDWNSPQGIVVNPCLFRHLGFDYKLDCDFGLMTTMQGSHDETVATRPQLVPK